MEDKKKLIEIQSRIVSLPDSRKLGYCVVGEGNPIIYFHGTASSRLEILLLKAFAKTNQFKLIGVDRPGYGLSTFTDRLSFHSFAKDVNKLVDHLNLTNHAILSWSGGGPFALAYAALFPQRITRAVIVGSPALPFDASTAHNDNFLAKIAMKRPFLAKWALRFFRKSILTATLDIPKYLKSRSGKNMVAEWSEPDKKFFSDPEWLRQMYGAMAEGFRQERSVETVFQEHGLFLKPWSENLENIPAGKVRLWQGAQDKTCPVYNVNRIAQIVKGANVEIFPDEGHCVLFANAKKLSDELK